MGRTSSTWVHLTTLALGDDVAGGMMTGIMNSLMSGSMDDAQLEALLRMLQGAGMLPPPPTIKPKTWSLVRVVPSIRSFIRPSVRSSVRSFVRSFVCVVRLNNIRGSTGDNRITRGCATYSFFCFFKKLFSSYSYNH